MNELRLEINSGCVDPKPFGDNILITPPIGDDYWLFRVKLTKAQAIIGFPKFGTIGIGFAKEKDWNTNLPYKCDAAEIFNHIKHNKCSRTISDDLCIAAIEMVRAAAFTLKSGAQQ